MNQNEFAVIILAAGQGKRMGDGLPKVLRLLKERPIISYVTEAVKKSEIMAKPVAVVCGNHDLVQQTLGEACEYVVQKEPLGTGHAVACAKLGLEGRVKKVIVLYGDMPLLRARTIAGLCGCQKNQDSVLTLFTTEVKDFEDWRKSFYNFGRIIRDGAGKIIAIREKKDCLPEELEIKEVNPGLYCFDAGWLWKNLAKLDNKNAQGEYYLTDLVKIAMEQGQEIGSVKIDPKECVGINTTEELELAESLVESP